MNFFESPEWNMLVFVAMSIVISGFIAILVRTYFYLKEKRGKKNARS